MVISVISRDDAVRIRRNLERRGAPVSDELRSATDGDTSAGTTSGAPAKGTPKAATDSPGKRAPAAVRGPATPAGSRSPRKAPAAPAPAAGARSSSSSSDRKLLSAGKSRPVPRSRSARGRAASILRSPSTLGGSDGGGVILAFLVYPLVLSIVQEGMAGPGTWLRAKFLNRDYIPPSGSRWTNKGAVSAAPGTTQYPPAGGGTYIPPPGGPQTGPTGPGLGGKL